MKKITAIQLLRAIDKILKLVENEEMSTLLLEDVRGAMIKAHQKEIDDVTIVSLFRRLASDGVELIIEQLKNKQEIVDEDEFFKLDDLIKEIGDILVDEM